MTGFEISEDGSITIDGIDTGFGVRQCLDRTVLYRREILPSVAYELGVEPIKYKEIRLPFAQYDLGHDVAAAGMPGLKKFEADVRDYLQSIRLNRTA